MYLYLSAAISFLIRPITWIFLFLIKALFSKSKYKNKNIFYSLLTLFLFTNPFLFNYFEGKWEAPAISMYQLSTYDVAVVLGGIHDFGTQEVDDRLNATVVSGRVTTTVELYHLGKIKHIILTSGDAATMKNKYEPEAPFLKNVLIRMGIPDSVITVESQSKTTRENAVYTKEILDKRNDKSILLITSAQHIPRSYACFSKIGIQCAAFPTDIWTEEISSQPKSYLTPNAKYLFYWQSLIREWIGYIVYKIKGEI